MYVKDVGEFSLIDRLARTIADRSGVQVDRLDEKGFRLILPIGDDAAAWTSPEGVRVITTDTMVDGTHFKLGQTGWRDLGWKALAVNLSDIGAMGCMPTFSIVTLGLTPDLPIDGLVEMYHGMLDLSDEIGGALVGGDIVRSPVFFITVAVVGAAVVGSLDGKSAISVLRRDAARPGDQIAVTGHLGCSGGGLRLLHDEEIEEAKSSGESETGTERKTHLKQAHQRPRPRVSTGMALLAGGVAAAMDVSDGLIDDLGKMCKASGVGAVLRADQIPADRYLKEEFPDDWLKLALGGGEDYELVFTAPETVMESVIPNLDVKVSIIGEIVSGEPGVKVITEDGLAVDVADGGWDHFRCATSYRALH